MESYIIGNKRLTPTIVGKIASKHFVVVVIIEVVFPSVLGLTSPLAYP